MARVAVQRPGRGGTPAVELVATVLQVGATAVATAAFRRPEARGYVVAVRAALDR